MDEEQGEEDGEGQREEHEGGEDEVDGEGVYSYSRGGRYLRASTRVKESHSGSEDSDPEYANMFSSESEYMNYEMARSSHSVSEGKDMSDGPDKKRPSSYLNMAPLAPHREKDTKTQAQPTPNSKTSDSPPPGYHIKPKNKAPPPPPPGVKKKRRVDPDKDSPPPSRPPKPGTEPLQQEASSPGSIDKTPLKKVLSSPREAPCACQASSPTAETPTGHCSPGLLHLLSSNSRSVPARRYS